MGPDIDLRYLKTSRISTSTVTGYSESEGYCFVTEGCKRRWERRMMKVEEKRHWEEIL